MDFLLRYQKAGGFLIEPEPVPFALIAQTASADQVPAKHWRELDLKFAEAPATLMPASLETDGSTRRFERAQRLILSTVCWSARNKHRCPCFMANTWKAMRSKATRLRTGISEVLDGGQQVIVLFSVVNTSKHAILLMPPQIQLGGQDSSGKLIKHEHWSTAEQLAVMDFRLSKSPDRTGRTR